MLQDDPLGKATTDKVRSEGFHVAQSGGDWGFDHSCIVIWPEVFEGTNYSTLNVAILRQTMSAFGRPPVRTEGHAEVEMTVFDWKRLRDVCDEAIAKLESNDATTV